MVPLGVSIIVLVKLPLQVRTFGLWRGHGFLFQLIVVGPTEPGQLCLGVEGSSITSLYVYCRRIFEGSTAVIF